MKRLDSLRGRGIRAGPGAESLDEVFWSDAWLEGDEMVQALDTTRIFATTRSRHCE